MPGACSALATGRPGIAVLPGMAQQLTNVMIGSNSTLVQNQWKIYRSYTFWLIRSQWQENCGQMFIYFFYKP